MNAHDYLKKCLDYMETHKGTDLYLKTDAKPCFRSANQLRLFEGLNTTTHEEMTRIAEFLMQAHHKNQLEHDKSVDLSFAIEGHGRLRANLFYQQGQLSCVIRVAWREIPSFEALRIPPILKKWALAERGLILIAGAASSGKSTTANAMINQINQNVEKHIITIEDPVEFLHVNKRSLINQREVGQDTPGFASALRFATRQAPDVIFIGEIRDAETFISAMAAAEIGRLVISTVHARSIMHVFERLLSFFPPDERSRVLVDISYNLNLIATQRLVPIARGHGYVPAFEILTMTQMVADMVRQQRLDKLTQVMQSGAADGMQSLNQSLVGLKNEGLISEIEMYRASDRPHELSLSMKGIQFGGGESSKKILGN
ncbi:MAG: type IV pili twitching motility protein PilT [Candidatus Omnitrophica bacterium CG11_big_fil_rev_8_21_14_0_20_45_26]|uniref:Type IV pili twitching motility protein PilT n=1 Tax=Candidatus Abzuiibacterium crystallinum TaxID=1974748 RepID=A0A2H0LPY2_9BACT|nr:MAG: type IV pili twitching motility protein PilT [Candidatus Omnitrophica bacterium CG11_big_fil_rev_8_21_14_0_20_45_26]PIW63735.1 MAG: type IV pili twitching motility protein PilT [Candidatus Omnitrophica bacterium CG12_big_fil_rev_8_21_14_0_65_45_16]